MAYTPELLSGSTDGKPIKVGATATPGTLIHTADATKKDEVYLFAANIDTVDRTITVEWGGATDPDDLLVKAFDVPAKSAPIPIAVGQRLTNSKVVRAFASVADKITITGWVNRAG